MQRENYETITHFCDDTSYREWVLTGLDNAGWTQWLEDNSDKRALAQQARYLLLAVGGSATEISADETELALEQTWWRIREREERVRPIWFGRWRQAAAAVVVFALGLSWFMSREVKAPVVAQIKVATQETRTVEVYNDSKLAKLINLEDGSSVILQPGGKLSYLAQFAADKREVHLSGEAFFEVSKNRRRPFLVYTKDILTEVVGTSFRIKAGDDQPDVEVSVKSGEVHVKLLKSHPDKITEPVVLLPNQSVSYLKSTNLFEKPENTDIPKRAIEYLNFDFDDAPVATIFSTIESAYGVTIDYPESALQECYLSTSLSDEPLLSKLKIVCESIGSATKFRVEGNQIIIESTGCN